jgi:hypothetical protein
MLLCDGFGFAGWRKGRNNLKKVKRLFRKAQNMKRSGSKNPVPRKRLKENVSSSRPTPLT